ncbi:MAG TPA: 2-phospho-L-lactate transferase [Acidimicrobiales bacterium]|nr:2-phospho-L-lactate transferase [Acidimicrobiales bacterium]
MITVLAGGVGAARLLRGLVHVVPPAEVTAVVNTGDDTVLHGLHISPDIDTVMYTLSGRNDDERGWGLAGETWTVMEALEALGGESWFRLGDRDLATHLYRTERLHQGATLSQATAELASALGVGVSLLPMSDRPVQTRLVLAADGREVGFQEYFVRLRHDVEVAAVRFAGVETAEPAPGVLEMLQAATTIVVAPSNPVVSIGPILAVPGVAEVLRQRRADVVAVSPIVAGAALKGPADRLLRELGEESSVVGIARRYASLVGTLVVDEADRTRAGAVEGAGVACLVAPTVMHGPTEAAALARILLRVPARP